MSLLINTPTIISYSEIFKFQTCQRQYYYRHTLGLSPIEESDAITTGVIGHRLLQSFYELLKEGKAKEEALDIITQNARRIIKSQKVTDFNLLTAWTLISNYIVSRDFTAEAILIENRFLFPASQLSDDPIFSDVQIGFTPDLVLKRKGNWIDVDDYKFVQRAWSQKKVNRYQQTKLYQIFLEHMGYEISRSVLRFFNVQTGKLIEKDYPLTSIQKEILIRDFMAGAKEVVRFKEGSFQSLAPRTVNYTACQFCQWEFPCGLEADGKDASKTLNTQYKKNTYDYSK